jgi:hypothetical protein
MLRRRKVVFASLAAFAFGIAFAAPPADVRSHWDPPSAPGSLWVPGTDVPMSVYETGAATLAPPR